MVIELISFTINSINIFFEQGIILTVTSCLLMQTADGEEAIPIPASNTRLVALLGKIVHGCALDEDGASLILEFDDGVLLRVEGGDEAYECFSVNICGKEIII